MTGDKPDTGTFGTWLGDDFGASESAAQEGIIAGYRVLRELGSGSMGTVYEAEQLALSRRVALKILAPHLSLSSGAVARFRREAEAAGRQQHPGLVAVYDVGQAGSVHYIAQELVEGGRTLEDELRQARRLSPLPSSYYQELALRFIAVAEALQHAHASGVIHRDIKPSNILITAAGQPKVTDFGLARMEDSLALSRTGDFAGTPYYASPEQAAAEPGAVDHRSDVFSLGTTLYESLCFQRPFEGDTLQQILQRVLGEDPRDPRRIRSMVPPELAAISLHALEKRRERRYATMEDFAADLRRYLDQQPIKARPPGPLRRGWKWLRRHPVISASGAVGAVALLVVSGLLGRIHVQNLALQVEVATAESALEFMSDMLQSVDPSEARGAEVTVKEMLDKGAVAIADSFEEQPEVRARLMGTMGGVYLALGRYEEAEPLLEEALRLRLRVLGDEHSDTLASRDGLAELRWRQARYSEAEPLVRSSLQLRRRLLGDEHPDTLQALDNLGSLQWQQERYAEAESHYLEALAGRRRVLGDEHPDTLITVNNLAVLYKVMGRYEEAEPLYLEDLQGSRRALGSDHPAVFVSLHNLASFYTSQQRYAEAEPLYLEALAGRRKVLGDEHPRTLNTQSKLADLYQAQDRFEEALPLLEQVLAAQRQALGEDHPKTIEATSRLAALQYGLARYELAEASYDQTLAAARRVLGAESTQTARILTGLGDLHEALGRYERAAPFYGEAYGIFSTVLGQDHPDTIEAEANIALIHWRQGRSDQAEALYLRSLEGARAALGADHNLALSIANNLAALYLVDGRSDQALPLYEEILAGSRRALGPKHQLTLVAANNLASVHRRSGDLQQAEDLYRQTVSDCRTEQGTSSPLLYKVLDGLVLTLVAQGRGAEALPLAREALEGHRRLLGEEHPNTRLSRDNLAALGDGPAAP